MFHQVKLPPLINQSTVPVSHRLKIPPEITTRTKQSTHKTANKQKCNRKFSHISWQSRTEKKQHQTTTRVTNHRKQSPGEKHLKLQLELRVITPK